MNYKYCPRCGNRCELEDNFCPRCHYDFQRRANNENIPSRTEMIQPKHHHKGLIISIIVIIVLVLLICCGIQLKHHQTQIHQRKVRSERIAKVHQHNKNKLVQNQKKQINYEKSEEDALKHPHSNHINHADPGPGEHVVHENYGKHIKVPGDPWGKHISLKNFGQ